MRRPSWLMSSTTPSATRKSASLDRLQAEKGRSCSAGLDLATFLISRRWPRVNFGGWLPLYLGYSELNPSALKLRITSRTRSSLVNATLAIAATSMPWADSRTICARRQVTTEPVPRRTIRTSRRPSSSSISRTRSRSVTGPVSAINTHRESCPAGANVTCYGTSCAQGRSRPKARALPAADEGAGQRQVRGVQPQIRGVRRADDPRDRRDQRRHSCAGARAVRRLLDDLRKMHRTRLGAAAHPSRRRHGGDRRGPDDRRRDPGRQVGVPADTDPCPAPPWLRPAGGGPVGGDWRLERTCALAKRAPAAPRR